LLVFYLGLATFGIWVVIMMWALLRALRQQEKEAGARAVSPSSPGLVHDSVS
jgi:hypothetical protein